MRIAYFTPLPPSKSGIADYNAELLPFLARGAEITVFVEQIKEARAHKTSPDFLVAEAIHFDELNTAPPFDICIYHQGNNPYHEYIYERALRTPGLLVLHEHCLHHLIAWKTLGREDWDAYRDEMFFAYGRSGAHLAEMRERDIGSEYQQFLAPLNRRIASHSLGIVVHNEFAASQIEWLDLPGRPRPRIDVMPHHMSPKVYELDRWDALECRKSLGIPESSFVVASLGFVTQSKRTPSLLRAFRKLLNLMPDAFCLIVGEDHWKWSVAPLVEELGLRDRVRITGYTTERDFFRYLKAVDVVVNLRYPTAGETSGTLVRALGAGKPVVVSDHGQFGDLPGDVCLKVQPGPEEENELFSRLRTLAYQPMRRERMSRAAMRWVREECGIERSAARYLTIAEQIIRENFKKNAHPQLYPLDSEMRGKTATRIRIEREEALEYVAGFFRDDPNATSYLKIHGERIMRTVELVPEGGPGQRLLELSSYLQMTPLIRRGGRYDEISVTNWWEGEPRVKLQRITHADTGEELALPMANVDVERERFPYADEYFDVALCCELIEHLTEDPMHMMIELHRVLKFGGLLILTTPNIASAFSISESMAGSSPYIYGSYNRTRRADRHSREYTPKDVRTVFEAAGFKVVRLFTENLWHKTDEGLLKMLDRTGVPRELRGDNIFAVGRKASYFVERYPERIYD